MSTSTSPSLGAKALQVLATVAPLVATAFGGPLAGVAVKAVESAFGGPGTVTDAALINATPDQLLALKKANDDFQMQMTQLGVQEEQLAYADTASARAREVAVKDSIPALLAIGITAGFFSVLGFMMKFGAPDGAGSEAFLVLLGALGTAWTSVFSYYFGSSAGARRSNETLGKIATNGSK